MRRVVVTGLGAVTPLGVGVKRSWTNLLAGRSGVVSIRGRFPTVGSTEIPSQVAALVPGWDAGVWVSGAEKAKMATFTQYAVAAAEEALGDAGWRPESEEERSMAGVCIGSGIGSLDDVFNTAMSYAAGGYKKVPPIFIPRLLVNLAAGHVSMRYGFLGPNHAVSTACTTGAHSIGDATRFIQHGDANIMLAGGSESCIHPLALSGFCRVKSLATAWNDDPAAASRPFDRDRAGFVIGEGAGIVVLEELEHAKRRGARVYAEVRGYGLSADAHHMTAPPESGRGARMAMRKGLVQAGVRPREVDYVNAHATSTVLGDAAENRAVRGLLLGEEGWGRAGEVCMSSTKGATGHLLGAAGAVEAIFTILAVHEDILPPTLNLGNPGNPADTEDAAAADEFDCNYVPNVAQRKTVNVAISNSFGFGGTNASLCFSKLR
ncbi:beta-ketoacyl synthase [Morchella conica CCBAS932]|uniref:3-oxoacyl-[acyl-carrier-protein] synthase n=1 Tax=Morchella conica CCBAS932 TaxID=1392247 RepID=A0A3N4KWW9_9PEZI|nr:beta-ketoacyl synthase [Morchella conica CCBAS932]